MKLDLFEEEEVKPKHDPGGKVRIALRLEVKGHAVFGVHETATATGSHAHGMIKSRVQCS